MDEAEIAFVLVAMNAQSSIIYDLRETNVSFDRCPNILRCLLLHFKNLSSKHIR